MSNKIFIYEPSLEGLLSAFAEALQEHTEKPIFLSQDHGLDLLPLSNVTTVEASEEKANQFFQKLNPPYAIHLKNIILKIWMSEAKLEAELYQIILLTLKMQKNILSWLSHPEVAKINKIAHKVSCEIHRFKGILRFSQTENNFFFAKFAPDANIILPISMHFKTRLKDENWAIFDTKRFIATIYQNGNLAQATMDQIHSLLSANFTNNELLIQKLWKTFFQSIAIPERINPKLQQHCLPKKYWKYLVEFS